MAKTPTTPTEGTRQVIYTYQGPADELPAYPTLTGLSAYLSKDRRAVGIRTGYSYTYFADGQFDTSWRACTSRMTVLSLRTGTLRAYTTIGEGPWGQVTPARALMKMRRGKECRSDLGLPIRHVPIEPDPFAHVGADTRPSLDDVNADERRLRTALNHAVLSNLLTAAEMADVEDPQGLLEAIVDTHPYPPLAAFAAALAYPWMQEYWRARRVPDIHIAGLLKKRTASDVRQVAQAQYGPKATRPVIKAFAEALTSTPRDPDEDGDHRRLPRQKAVQVTTTLRSLLPPDTIAELLALDDGGRTWELSDELLRWVRTVLRHASLPRRKRLATEIIAGYEGGGWTNAAQDAYAMALQLGDRLDIADIVGRSRTWTEIHDAIVEIYNAAQTEMDAERWNYPLEAFPSEFSELDGETLDHDGASYTLVVPKVVGTLTEWGTALHHCIGSYGARAATADTLLFALECDGTLHSTGEINRMRHDRVALGELMASFNRPVDAQLREKVDALLRDRGVYKAEPAKTFTDAERQRLYRELSGGVRLRRPIAQADARPAHAGANADLAAAAF